MFRGIKTVIGMKLLVFKILIRNCPLQALKIFDLIANGGNDRLNPKINKFK